MTDKRFNLIALTVLVGVMVLWIAISNAGGYTCYPSASIPFTYDPNQVNFKLIAAVSMVAGESLIEPIKYDDPDGDPIVACILAGPPGFSIAGQGKDWSIRWTPTANDVGLHYIDLQIEDIPEGGDALTDEGTIVIMVHKANAPPILRWLCGDGGVGG